MALRSDRVARVESLLPAALHASGIAARVDDTWLQLRAWPRLDSFGVRADLWPLLGRNARMAGPIRLALAPGSHALSLCADLSIEDGADEEIEAGVVNLCQAFRRSARAFSGIDDSDLQVPIGFGAGPAHDSKRVAELCSETGWPCTTRPTGDTVIMLNAGPTSYTARLESGGNDALNIVVDLFDAKAYSPDSRAAAALLLLTASAVVRSVKGVARLNGDGEIGAVAASCVGPVSTAVLDRALASLTVACQLVGREAQAIGDRGLARDYLAWRGWDDTSSPVVAEEFEDHRPVVPDDAPVPTPSFG